MTFHRNPIRTLTMIPSSIITRNIFTVDECNKIVEDVKSLVKPTQGTLSGELKDKKRRNSTVRWFSSTPEFKWIFDKIDYVFNQVNNEWFNFNLIGYSQIQFTEYDSTESQHYAWHTDMVWAEENMQFAPDSTLRKLSCSIVLNQQEVNFEGGDFELDNILRPTVPELDKGDGIFFPSFVWHQVKPVTKGTRYSLVVWMIGPPFQ